MVRPAVEYPAELLSQQRAALVVYHLGVLGRCYTTEEIAALVGLSHRGALYLMEKLSGIYGVPVTQLDDGRWLMLPGG